MEQRESWEVEAERYAVELQRTLTGALVVPDIFEVGKTLVEADRLSRSVSAENAAEEIEDYYQSLLLEMVAYYPALQDLYTGGIQRAARRSRIADIILSEMGEKTCEWTEDEDGICHTKCGEEYCYEESIVDAMKHGTLFCQHCGGRITTKEV